MTNRARQPRLAIALVGLFTSENQSEALVGDLLEEFSSLVSQSGTVTAHSWLWRQSVNTIAQLALAALREAPWPIVSGMVLGFVLRWLVIGLPDHIIVAILRAQTPYSNLHYGLYIWLVTWGTPLVRLLELVLIGCIVAIAAKRQEIVATMTLGLVSAVVVGALLLRLSLLHPGVPSPWHSLLESVVHWTAIVFGGLIVRIVRSARRHRLSTP
jgi:hypothetical protein